MANWTLSKKVVLASAIIAFISLFLKWAEVNFIFSASVNGFQQQGWLFLLIFIYPLYCAFKAKKVNTIGGYVLSGLGFVGMILYIMSLTEPLTGQNLASTGAYVMLISFIVLAVGVFLDSKN